MDFKCQKEALYCLSTYAQSDKHSILIEGPEGCGKTYCAKLYADMLNVSDFYKVDPGVNEIRDTVDACYKLTNSVVLCIENLDLGVSGASYAMLKFLEEPLSNVYIVVTCRNRYKVPDTILSRSVVCSVSPPTRSDLCEYALHIDSTKLGKLEPCGLWACAKTFKDVDTLLSMSDSHIKYIQDLTSITRFNRPISDMVWKLGHFDDNSETPIQLVIRYIMQVCNSPHIDKCGIDCMRELASSKIAAHTVLTKFLFECKYTE